MLISVGGDAWGWSLGGTAKIEAMHRGVVEEPARLSLNARTYWPETQGSAWIIIDRQTFKIELVGTSGDIADRAFEGSCERTQFVL
jgi:hypothetical protein